MKFKITTLSLIIITIFFLFIGCAEEDLNSGIYGNITLGPINPVEREGEENTKPYQAAISIKNQSGTREIERFTSDKDGRFKVFLKPGTYLVDPLPGGSPFPFAKPQAVTVESNKFIELNIMYDTGIR